MAIINLHVFCSFRFIEFENGSYYMLVFEPNVFCHIDFKQSECINLVITDIHNLKMAVINSDVFGSFRFIEFENGSHYTV